MTRRGRVLEPGRPSTYSELQAKARLRNITSIPHTYFLVGCWQRELKDYAQDDRVLAHAFFQMVKIRLDNASRTCAMGRTPSLSISSSKIACFPNLIERLN